ncbi:MAG: phosphatase PAP2 family protein [Patescibacteria group bacterium]|jgi:undecaprenyl-diphosphatase
MSLDKKIAEKVFLATKHSDFFSWLAVFGATKLIWLLAAAVFLWSLVTGRIVPVLLSVAFTWILQLAIAYLFNRHRPFQQNHEKPLMNLLWRTPSFPSGHTSLSCGMAAAVFAYDPLLGSLFFILAALIAFCRIAVGVHYVSDIIGGAVLGITVATFVTHFIL